MTERHTVVCTSQLLKGRRVAEDGLHSHSHPVVTTPLCLHIVILLRHDRCLYERTPPSCSFFPVYLLCPSLHVELAARPQPRRRPPRRHRRAMNR